MIKFLPIVIFAVLVGFLYRGLALNPSEVPSPFIGKLAPAVQGPVLNAESRFNSADLNGQVWILNVWASWCRECVYEHPMFLELARAQKVPIIGLNYKDQSNDAVAWLGRFGNPYSNIVEDQDGGIGIDWGVYAVPETFIIDKKGVVRHKVIGPISEDSLQNDILPLLDSLLEQSS